MYMTFTDLRTKLLGDATFAKQFVTDAASVNITVDILDANTSTVADAVKIDGNPNLLNTYIKVVNEIAKNNSLAAYNRLPVYIHAPFGEPEFSIDTNTRVITIPRDFSLNGVGVVGDHLAEILFFRMPRFFDVMDLNDCNIYIYWQNTGLKDDAEPHIYRPVAKNAETDELIFGWAVSEDVTAAAGKVEFSVEFIHRQNGSSGAVDFRLITQPATVNVKNALVFSNEGEIEPEDQTSIVFGRNIYSNILNLLSAAPAVITKNLNPLNDVLVDGFITMDIEAVSNDGGTVLYQWVWNEVMVDQPNGSVINNTALDNGAEKYELIAPKEIEFTEPTDPTNPGDKTYKKLKTNVPGIYVVYVGNKITDPNSENYNGIRYIYSEAVYIEPAKPITIDSSKLPGVIYLDQITNSNPLKVEVKGANGTVSYDWWQKPSDGAGVGTPVKRQANGPAQKNINEFSDALEPHKDASLRGIWWADGLNDLNNTRTHAKSNEVFVEMPPVKIDAADLTLTQETATRFAVQVAQCPHHDMVYQMYATVTVQVMSNGSYIGVERDVQSAHKIFRSNFTADAVSGRVAGTTIDLGDMNIANGQEYDLNVWVVPVAQYDYEDYRRYATTVDPALNTSVYAYTRKTISKLHGGQVGSDV